MSRDITKLVANSQLIRATVSKWKAELPESTIKAVSALNDVRAETAQMLESKAVEWQSENKLIHAGAALRLAKELKKKIGG